MSAAGTVDEALDEGIEIDRFLALVAIAGLAGWLLTQALATVPGAVLGVVGVEVTTVIFLGWLGCTLGVAGLGGTAAAGSVRYDPLVWGWGLLIAGAFALNAAVILIGVVPQSLAPYALWHPWIVAYAVGFLVTGTVATDRSRTAYYLGSIAAVIVLVAALTFPQASGGVGFALMGLLHAGPLLADVAYTRALAPTDRSPEVNVR